MSQTRQPSSGPTQSGARVRHRFAGRAGSLRGCSSGRSVGARRGTGSSTGSTVTVRFGLPTSVAEPQKRSPTRFALPAPTILVPRRAEHRWRRLSGRKYWQASSRGSRRRWPQTCAPPSFAGGAGSRGHEPPNRLLEFVDQFRPVDLLW